MVAKWMVRFQSKKARNRAIHALGRLGFSRESFEYDKSYAIYLYFPFDPTNLGLKELCWVKKIEDRPIPYAQGCIPLSHDRKD